MTTGKLLDLSPNGFVKGGALGIALLIAAIGIVCTALLSVLIVTFNRPRFLVAPHQRSELGTVPHWWRVRARKSSA